MEKLNIMTLITNDIDENEKFDHFELRCNIV